MSDDDRVEFEFGFDKMFFKYKGPARRGEAMQQNISNAMRTIAEVQQQAGTDQPTVPASRLIDAKVSDANGDANGKEKKARRKSSGKLTELITGLQQGGFFAKRRRTSEIKHELAKQAQNFEDNHIAAALVHMTKKGSVKREKNADGVWEYFV